MPGLENIFSSPLHFEELASQAITYLYFPPFLFIFVPKVFKGNTMDIDRHFISNYFIIQNGLELLSDIFTEWGLHVFLELFVFFFYSLPSHFLMIMGSTFRYLSPLYSDKEHTNYVNKRQVWGRTAKIWDRTALLQQGEMSTWWWHFRIHKSMWEASA